MSRTAHRIEECTKNAKGEAGLADDPARNWIAWHHHQSLSMLAAWFLNQEARRGKDPDPGADAAATAAADRRPDRRAPQGERTLDTLPPQHAVAATKRASQALSPQIT